MHTFRLMLVTAVILALVSPTEAWAKRLREAFKRVGVSMGKIVTNLQKPFRKVGCRVIFGIGCPAAIGAAGAAIAGGKGGLGQETAEMGSIVGRDACSTRIQNCKRSVISGEILVPFSDRFTDYDENNDKLISYEEFAFAIMKSLPMANPEELREPFIFADLDGNKHLTIEEFQGAPFLFRHGNYT